MRSRRLLTLGPDNEPLWVRLYVQPYGDRWAAMIVGYEAPSPDAGTLTGLTLFSATSGEAEQEAKVYLGMAELTN